MADVLGIDTSNYTTSAAVLDTDDLSFVQCKQLLPVKPGEKGLRQSDAVFHHTKQLPEMISSVVKGKSIKAIGVSVKPRLAEGSYMPCFLVGEGAADSIGSVIGAEPDKTSHQVGHILAALYSSQRLDLLRSGRPFLAFHVSGGTTDMLLCNGDRREIVACKTIGASLDLKAGQLIDRTGLMLGLKFPCGAELEKLALQSNKEYYPKPVIKGLDCCLSGIENKCKDMLAAGEEPCDIAMFCLCSVYSAIRAMTRAALDISDVSGIVYAGGVMSDKLIAERLAAEFDADFAAPDLSCDNAVGVALFSAFRKGLIR
ncbi:MAG: peptidase M22 [Ruminococcus sp.]|nr:peptidase M22 [Ruminococcus sp.]